MASAWVVPRWGGLCGTQVATGRTETVDPVHEEWQTRLPNRQIVDVAAAVPKTGRPPGGVNAGLLTICSQVPVALAVTQHLGGAWCGAAVGIGRKPFPIWTVVRCRVRNVK